MIVRIKVIDTLIRFFSNKQWWDHVIVNPDDSKIIVFSKGTLRGLIVLIPAGGQEQPISTEGESLLWKNAQKKARKKQISLIINRIIPSFSPAWVRRVCFPMYVASRTTSRHHWNIDSDILSLPNRRRVGLLRWNKLINPSAMNIALMAEVIGQGLNSTTW